MNKQELASRIWESANKMRSKIEANEYKDYILGFIFYKFLSDKEERFLKENDFSTVDIQNLTEDDEDTVKFIQNRVGYFIAYKDLFSTWLNMGTDFDVSNVRDALSAFTRLINPNHKKVFDGIFNTLETGLSKLGESSGAQTKAISGLIHLIKDIPMDGRQDYDVLGFIYEYLISMFAANAGKKAGEFYTPHEVSFLMSEIVAEHLKDKDSIDIYDPTSGSGSLLINIGRSVAKHIKDENNIKYYAQELKQNTYNLTRMNLIMRGIIPDNIYTRNADTLEEDWPFFEENKPETYHPLYVDAVVSNPPYSQKWDSEDKEQDPRYSRFGLAPSSKADYAFLLHDLYHIKPDGIMTIVLPHGVLFRSGEEAEIRRNLIEYNHIDAIIGLPANIFFGTGIPTIIMVLKQKRENNDVLIIDASKGFEKVGKNNKLRASDIKRIVDTVSNRETIDKYSKVVSRDEIRANEYNLNIPRYVDSSNKTESWDIYSSMFGGIPNSEIDEFSEYWHEFSNLKRDLFRPISSSYSEINTDNIERTILEHTDIRNFTDKFTKAFDNFGTTLKTNLIENMQSVNISQSENIIGDDIFARLCNIGLVDKYSAYQILDDNWSGKIATDLEIIQTEGFDATKKVKPNMVIKKKDGKEQEVQDGWLGHIFPFPLVQNIYFKQDLDNIEVLEERLNQISAEYEEILDTMSEEDKQSDTINEDGTAFVNAEVIKKAKEVNAEIKNKVVFAEDSFELKIVKVGNLIIEERKLKTEVKKQKDNLHKETKAKIESLTDDESLFLLNEKWIKPLLEEMSQISNKIVKELIKTVVNLANKYKETFEDIESGINSTEKELAKCINDLNGNEFDKKGLAELQFLFQGVIDDRK